jgi:2',3'-cyclic-nucleotide 2'-phosphodiesterase (5'-nucleotidase family)
MKIKHIVLLLATLLWSNACTTSKKIAVAPSNDFTEAIFLQVNDVYEITALENGKRGGLARVATILKKLEAENKNTFFVIAGDFFNPSVIGTLKYQDKAIKGRQMVDVLNQMGLDYAILGNHEFDLDQADFQARVDESKFKWISTDVNTTGNTAFRKKNADGTTTPFPTSEIISIPTKNGENFKIGLFSATIPLIKKDWIVYNDYKASAKTQSNILNAECNVVLGLTHLEIKQDRELATLLPNVPLFMGGHDHDNMKVQEGNTTITKADANAKSVYIHRVRLDNMTKKVSIVSETIAMDEKITPDAAVAEVVNKWKNIAQSSMAAQGFNAERVVKKVPIPMDAQESMVRHHQCEIGAIITTSFLKGSREKAVCAFFNSGSVRIDDKIQGDITEYDIIRILPYGGQVVEVTMKGSLLKKVLDAGESNKGKGGYLQRTTNIAKVNTNWAINGNLIDDKTDYTVVTGAFLFSGKEAGLEFFNAKNPEIVKAVFPKIEDKTDIRNDSRKLLIDYLMKN